MLFLICCAFSLILLSNSQYLFYLVWGVLQTLTKTAVGGDCLAATNPHLIQCVDSSTPETQGMKHLKVQIPRKALQKKIWRGFCEEDVPLQKQLVTFADLLGRAKKHVKV